MREENCQNNLEKQGWFSWYPIPLSTNVKSEVDSMRLECLYLTRKCVRNQSKAVEIGIH